MSSSGRSRFPFTTSQWQELEHQALVFKYMVAGMQIPPDLLFIIRRSLDSSLSSKLLLHQPQHIGWNGFQMGFGRKIDPEPGRCRRTDGKKWRCSKEAYPDSKYCERHMHRGRNRSRKPVEIPAAPNAINPTNNNKTQLTKNTQSSSSPSSPSSSSFHSISADQSHFPYPHFSAHKAYRNSHGHGMMKGEADHEHSFFQSEMNSNSVNDSSWELAPLTMGSSLSSQLKDHNAYNSSGWESNWQQLQLLTRQQQQNHDHRRYGSACDMHLSNIDQQPKKVMHHFLDESPPKDRDSWPINPEDKLSKLKTQLSMSIPNSLHDFFMAEK